MKVEFKINKDAIWVGVERWDSDNFSKYVVNLIPCVSILVTAKEFKTRDKKRLLRKFNEFLKVKTKLDESLEKRDNYKKAEYGKQYSSLLAYLKNELTGESLRKFRMFLKVSHMLTDELVAENKMMKNQCNDLIEDIREELKK